MAIASTKMKGGRAYANYACGAYHQKGKAICSNSLHVSERKAVAAIIGAIRELVAEPNLVTRFIEKFNLRVRQAHENAQREDAGARDIDAQLANAHRRVTNLDAIAKLGLDEDLLAQFTTEKAALQRLRDQKEARAALLVPAKPVADASVARRYLDNLLLTLEASPERSRKLLAEHLSEVLLTPQHESGRDYYMATGGLDISVALGFESRATKSLNRKVAGAGFEPATFGL